MIELQLSNTPSLVRPYIKLRPGQEITLGRECGDYCFEDDNHMSGAHLRVVAAEEHIEFLDLESTNGTFLNGRRAPTGVAHDGDELRIGQTTFTVLVVTDECGDSTRPRLDLISSSNHALEISVEGQNAKRLECGNRLTVGRTTRAEWVFPEDEQMSGLHFVIENEGRIWEIVDAQSSNGTFLNGTRIERTIIDDGDVVKAGTTIFRMHLVASTTPQPHLDRPTPPAPDTVESGIFTPSKPPATPSPATPAPATPAPATIAPATIAPATIAPATIVPAFEPAPNSRRPNKHDTIWLEPRTAEPPTAESRNPAVPVCMARGGTIAFGNVSYNNGVTRLHSQVALHWRKQWCEFWKVSESTEVSLNDIPKKHGELQANDRLKVGDCTYEVRYDCDPTSVNMTWDRQPETSSLTIATNADRDAPYAGKESSHKIVRAELVDYETQPTDVPAIVRDRHETIKEKSTTEPVIPAPIASSKPLPAPPQPPASQPPALQPLASQPSGPQPQEHASASTPAPKPVPMPSSMPLPKAVVGATQVVVLEGMVPDGDFIAGLIALSACAKTWLVPIDLANPACLSLPFPVLIDDAAWMVNAQAGWPRNNYLVAFSTLTLEKLFESLVGIAPEPGQSAYNQKNIGLWLNNALEKFSGPSLHGLVFFEGASNHWKFWGSAIDLPKVIDLLQAWKDT